MEPSRRKQGRPAGKEFTHVRSIHFKDSDVERMRALAEKWECSEAAAVRRALLEASQREGLES